MTWLTSLPVRLTIGLTILAALALYDLHRRKQNATRWREYAVLLLATVVAMTYGVLNDQLTAAISWEYFYYGKGLDEKLGPQTPPDTLKLHLHAVVIGMQATWSAGLILGVALLIANNPSKRLPRLPYPQLLRTIPLILAITAATAAVGEALGYTGLLQTFHEDFPDLLRQNLWRPRRFMAVYGIHMGGYVGALIGLVVAVNVVVRRRRQCRLPGFPVATTTD